MHFLNISLIIPHIHFSIIKGSQTVSLIPILYNFLSSYKVLWLSSILAMPLCNLCILTVLGQKVGHCKQTRTFVINLSDYIFFTKILCQSNKCCPTCLIIQYILAKTVFFIPNSSNIISPNPGDIIPLRLTGTFQVPSQNTWICLITPQFDSQI